jgi:hypothetical protein
MYSAREDYRVCAKLYVRIVKGIRIVTNDKCKNTRYKNVESTLSLLGVVRSSVCALPPDKNLAFVMSCSQSLEEAEESVFARVLAMAVERGRAIHRVLGYTVACLAY